MASPARIPLDASPDWLQPGAMALLLVDLQHGTCGNAQPRPRPGIDQRFRAATLPAALRALTLAPAADELLLAKSSSSPFSSTTLDYLLRNIGIRTLVVIGLLTDQCIDHTIKDAADRGYRVVCLTDACQAETTERHDQALACFQGYAELLTGAQFAGALERAGLLNRLLDG